MRVDGDGVAAVVAHAAEEGGVLDAGVDDEREPRVVRAEAEADAPPFDDVAGRNLDAPAVRLLISDRLEQAHLAGRGAQYEVAARVEAEAARAPEVEREA